MNGHAQCQQKQAALPDPWAQRADPCFKAQAAYLAPLSLLPHLQKRVVRMETLQEVLDKGRVLLSLIIIDICYCQ